MQHLRENECSLHVFSLKSYEIAIFGGLETEIVNNQIVITFLHLINLNWSCWGATFVRKHMQFTYVVTIMLSNCIMVIDTISTAVLFYDF